MKVGPHVMTHKVKNHHHDRAEVVPRVGGAQAGGNLKLIQCQLMLLLHARRCQQRHELVLARSQNGGDGGGAGDDGGNGGGNAGSVDPNSVARALLLNCPIRHCHAMKEVLQHMKQCRNGQSCTYQHCTTSLRILSHYTNCTIEDCPLCMLVRMRMTRAKEWEATLPRSSRYTLLAAALRSSQVPVPIPPNCNMAEQAQEGQSGVPCQEEMDLRRQWPVVAMMNDNQHGAEGEREQACDNNNVNNSTATAAAEKCGKCSIPIAAGPSLDQVRKAYEQLGIPCPEAALQRLMATLPSSSSSSSSPNQQRSSPERTSPPAPGEEDTSSADENSMDVSDNDTNSSNGDQGVFDCYCSCASPSPQSTRSDSPSSIATATAERIRQIEQQQHPVITSTTSSTAPLRLPNKSSR